MLLESKIRKLFSVSLKELFFRIKEKIQEKHERWKYIHKRNPTDYSAYAPVKASVIKNRFFSGAFYQEKRKKLLIDYSYDKNTLKTADSLLKNQVTLLGHDMHLLHRGGLFDPVHNIEWPAIFYTEVLFHKTAAGKDVKLIWEINRHQYLISLAKAYWLTGHEIYAKKVFDTIGDWIKHNPYNTGVNWTSSLELAVRVISWLWVMDICRNSICYNKKTVKKITRSIWEQSHYMSRHLSYYSSPYNHLVGEGAALHLVGTLFPEFKTSQKWETLGWNILTSFLEKQFYSDGMTVEQAFFYHHFTLGFYLQAILLRIKNHQPVPEKLLNCIEQAIEISIYMARPDGNLPMVGDIDNARSLYFYPDYSWNFTAFYGLGAVLFNRPDFKARCKGVPEEMLWLLDDDQLEKFLAMKPKDQPETSRPFYDSGYFVMRDSWEPSSHYLLFDCGELSDGLSEKGIPSAAHGHADALAFELCAYGVPFIVDSGFYTYFGDIEWHKHFRQQEAHNTLKIEGYRQAEYCGRLKWMNVKIPELIQWEITKHSIVCSGKVDYAQDVSHTRAIHFEKEKFWIIRDSVQTGGKGITAETYLHFDPEVDITIDYEKCEIIAQRDDVRLFVRFLGQVQIKTEKGGASPWSGWVCPGYGMKQPAWRVVVSWIPDQCGNQLPFILVPCQSDSLPFTMFEHGDSNTVALRYQEEEYMISFPGSHDIAVACSEL